MYIRKLTYKKGDVDCKLCTEYRGKKHGQFRLLRLHYAPDLHR